MLLALAVCLQLFFFSRGFYAVSWDESARTLDAYSWAAHGTPQTPQWLPFYRILVGLGVTAFPDLFLTPRIITFLFGLATIPAAAWLAHELFQSRKVTMATMLLATFAPQRIALSLAPLSEIMFIFAILLSMASFARWLSTNARSSLMLGGLFVALAGTIRYEGWLFGLAILAAAATRAPGKERLLAGAIVLAFPLIWIGGKFVTANPVAAVVAGAQQYTPGQVLTRNPLIDFAVANTVSLNLIGVVYAARRRTVTAIMFGPLAAMSLIFLLTRAAATGASWRITAVWSILLLPFTAFLLTRIGKAAGPLVTLVLLAAFLFNTFRIEKASRWAFPRSDRDAGAYIDHRIAGDPSARILIESSTYAYLNIEVASQHPDAFVNNSAPEQPLSPRIVAPGASLPGTLKAQGITLLMFRSRDYQNFLNRSSEVVKLKDFGEWSIYQLVRLESTLLNPCYPRIETRIIFIRRPV